MRRYRTSLLLLLLSVLLLLLRNDDEYDLEGGGTYAQLRAEMTELQRVGSHRQLIG